MLTIKSVIASGTCTLCDKEKEVAAVIMDGHAAGEILLCWADVRKMTHMQMRMNGHPIASRRALPPMAEVLDEPGSPES